MKPFFRKPKPVEPSELERLASLWLQAGLILISLGIIATAATWWRSGWRVAAMPFLFFMLPAAVSLVYRSLLLTGKTDPGASLRHHTRSRAIEAGRLVLWLVAFLVFLVWGLSGGWSLAWTVLLATGLMEWGLDRYTKRRKS